jgi:FkbM family methyltransferase
MASSDNTSLEGHGSFMNHILSYQKDYLQTCGNNESIFVSHSLNFEDVILHRLFSNVQVGFYVDVGAGHPCFENDTFALYQRGWLGINIEPNRRFHAALLQERPRDTNLAVAVSDRPGEITYYEVGRTGLSTCDAEQARIYRDLGHSVVMRQVPVRTLSTILTQADVSHINILKVDVEGFEEKVLSGNDWARFRPDVVVVEATYPNTPIRRPTDIKSSMEQRGYRHIYFDGLNDFYVECEFVAPEGLGLPPNVFDRFILRQTADRDQELRELRARLQNIYMSRSWFLTKPWRFAGRAVKRMLVRAAKHLRPWLAA